MVTISLKGLGNILSGISKKSAVEGTLKLSDSAKAIGYIVNKDQIQIAENGDTDREIQFVWDSSKPGNLKMTLSGKNMPLTFAAMTARMNRIKMSQEVLYGF